jgi:lysozyme
MKKQISQNGINVLKSLEGCRLKAYKDESGHWTIGWGYAGIDVWDGLMITQFEADDLLYKEMALREDAINELVQINLNQNQFDSLCSFVYNVGIQAFADSTMLKLLNAGDYQAAADEFPRWIYSEGIISDILVKRRATERNLFLLS